MPAKKTPKSSTSKPKAPESKPEPEKRSGLFRSKPSIVEVYPLQSNPQGRLVLRLHGSDLPALIRCYSADVMPGGVIQVRMEDRSSTLIYISPSSYEVAEVFNAEQIQRDLVDSAA